MQEFQEPEPTNQIAEDFALRVDFRPGCHIEPLVERLGGELRYLASFDSVEGKDGSLIVWGRGDFAINVSAFTGPARDRFTIAHELGHYVLHAREGQRRIRAARFGFPGDTDPQFCEVPEAHQKILDELGRTDARIEDQGDDIE